MSEPVIREATLGDLPGIARVQAASPEASHWPPHEYLALRCTVAEVEGVVVGFLVTRETAPGEHEILNLAVDPQVRRRGIARSLLASELLTRGNQWYLEVRASNQAAISLYESFHFHKVGVRNNYYDSPPESAIVMRIFS